MRHANEWNGRCLDCQREQRQGIDLPVCSHPEPAEDPRFCAWCGHEVKA